MSTTTTVDAARVELLLSELRLPGVKLIWAKLAEQSDKEGWPAARFPRSGPRFTSSPVRRDCRNCSVERWPKFGRAMVRPH